MRCREDYLYCSTMYFGEEDLVKSQYYKINSKKIVKYKLRVELLRLQHNAGFYIKCAVRLEDYLSSGGYRNKQNHSLLLSLTYILIPVYFYWESEGKEKDYLWL